MDDYTVRLMGFPSGKVHEAVAMNEDGTYTIFLDKNITHEMQRERFMHAVNHILGRDFEKFDVQKIEYQAHKEERL